MTKSRTTTLLLLMLLAAFTTYAQKIQLTGQVSIHNSKYHTGAIQYVPNAYITAAFTSPATTDANGRFELQFIGLDAGTTVQIEAEKAGLEVVNSHDLGQVVIGRTAPVPIYLAPKGQLAKAQTELYNISRQALFARRDALIARLRASEADSKAAIAELEAQLGQQIATRKQAEQLLLARISTIERRLPEFAQKLARQNLDFVSDLYIEAYQLFKQGKVEAVVALLSDTKLENAYLAAVTQLEKGTKLAKAAQRLEQSAHLQMQQAISNYVLKAEAYSLLFKLEQAALIYEQVIDLHHQLGTNPITIAQLHLKVSDLCHENRQMHRQKTHCKTAVSLVEQFAPGNHTLLALAYSHLAWAYFSANETGHMQAYLTKALDHYLAINYKRPALGRFFMNMGKTLYFSGKPQEAVPILLEGTELFEQFGMAGRNVAYLYLGLAVTYDFLEQHQQAIACAKKSIQIAQKQVLHIYLKLHLEELEELLSICNLIFHQLCLSS